MSKNKYIEIIQSPFTLLTDARRISFNFLPFLNIIVFKKGVTLVTSYLVRRQILATLHILIWRSAILQLSSLRALAYMPSWPHDFAICQLLQSQHNIPSVWLNFTAFQENGVQFSLQHFLQRRPTQKESCLQISLSLSSSCNPVTQMSSNSRSCFLAGFLYLKYLNTLFIFIYMFLAIWSSILLSHALLPIDIDFASLCSFHFQEAKGRI